MRLVAYRNLVKGKITEITQSSATGNQESARIANTKLGDNQHTGSANLRIQISQEQAADLLKVSVKNVEKAKSLLDSADPALVKLIEETGSKLSSDAARRSKAFPKK